MLTVNLIEGCIGVCCICTIFVDLKFLMKSQKEERGGGTSSFRNNQVIVKVSYEEWKYFYSETWLLFLKARKLLGFLSMSLQRWGNIT